MSSYKSCAHGARESHPSKHTLGLWALRELSLTVRTELAECKGMISTGQTAMSTQKQYGLTFFPPQRRCQG